MSFSIAGVDEELYHRMANRTFSWPCLGRAVSCFRVRAEGEDEGLPLDDRDLAYHMVVYYAIKELQRAHRGRSGELVRISVTDQNVQAGLVFPVTAADGVRKCY